MACLVTIVELAQFHKFEVLRVDFGPQALVTAHPVEQGAEVSDHVQVLPHAFTVEAYVTASPLGPIPIPFAIQDTIGFLEQAMGKLLTVLIDGEGSFSNCVLEGWPHTRTAVEGRVFALRFKQVHIASSLSVSIPPRMPAPPAAAGGPSEQALGQQSTTPGVPASALKQAKDAAATPFETVGAMVGGLF